MFRERSKHSKQTGIESGVHKRRLRKATDVDTRPELGFGSELDSKRNVWFNFSHNDHKARMRVVDGLWVAMAVAPTGETLKETFPIQAHEDLANSLKTWLDVMFGQSVSGGDEFCFDCGRCLESCVCHGSSLGWLTDELPRTMVV